MTSKNIFNALRNIDEKLILGASPSENNPSRKKNILFKVLASVAAVILVISLSIGGVMMLRRDGSDEMPNDENGEDKGWLNNGWHNDESISKMFYSIEEFDAYRNGPDNVKGEYHYFDNSLYVDFDSIIPNSEIGIIVLHPENTYEMRYFNETNPAFSIDFCIVEDYVLSEGSIHPTYIMDCRIEDLKDIHHNGYTNYIFVVDGIEVLYQFDNYSDKIGVVYISFIIGDQLFAINSPFNKNNTPAQQEFVDAFRTEASTSAMLHRIKALISGMDADEGGETQEEPDNTVSSDSGDSLIDQIANGYQPDEEEYFYEDNDFPVIPGISPDWKPNANGKYPLKEAYTKYEISLILAGEIPLDLPEEGIKFGSETFPIIDETEE